MAKTTFENYYIDYLQQESPTFQEGNDTIYKEGAIKSWNYNKSTKSGWGLDPSSDSVVNNLTVVGILTGSQIHIPDTTSQASLHVNEEGDFWLGCNVDSWETVELLDNKWIRPNALAYIENNGFARFQDLLVGDFRITDDYLYPLTGATIQTAPTSPAVAMSENGLVVTGTLIDVNNSIISIDLTSTIDGSLIPNIDSTYYLGSATKYWKEIFVDKVWTDAITCALADGIKVGNSSVIYPIGGSSTEQISSGYLSTLSSGEGQYNVNGNPYGGYVMLPGHTHIFTVSINLKKIPARINGADDEMVLEITGITD